MYDKKLLNFNLTSTWHNASYIVDMFQVLLMKHKKWLRELILCGHTQKLRWLKGIFFVKRIRDKLPMCKTSPGLPYYMYYLTIMTYGYDCGKYIKKNEKLLN